jgi:hypothetical protein
MRLTKLDVVQRQLRTAIRMFFEDADTVSAYTLAAAAEGVLTGLLKKQGKVHPFRESDFISGSRRVTSTTSPAICESISSGSAGCSASLATSRGSI